MKIIGVLGGLGPQATMDFEARVHAISQQLIAPEGNRGYPPMVVLYYRHSPFLMQGERMPVFPLQPDPRLLAAAKQLGACADFLVILSNGVHHVQEALEHASDLKVLSMIEVTLDEVYKRGWHKVGLLTLGPPTVYSVPLEKQGIAYAGISQELAGRLNQAIFRCQAGQEDATDRAITHEALVALRNQRVDGIILGCTELPFLLQEEASAPDLLNPAQFLAEAAVRYALE
ncbi:MAG TPA: aspartate/glutamate racemase family protein [Ktedonobacteraceae bacterium]